MVENSKGPQTANEIWSTRVRDSADQVAFRHRKGVLWQDVSWQQADTAAGEIAAGLVALGLRRGDTVCILAQTSLEWVLCDLGAARAGVVTVPIYSSSTPEQCAFIARDSAARLVFADDALQVDKLRPWATEAARPLVQLQGQPNASSSVAGDAPVNTLDSLRAAGRAWSALPANADELARRASAVKPADTFTIIYTSGTTGNPKGAIVSHENLVAGCASAIRALSLNEQDSQYLFLPLAHVLGRQMEWAPIFVGATTTFSEGINKIKDNLVEVRPTFMAGVPRIFEKFYAGVQAGSKQGSPAKKALVAWAFGVGDRYAAARRTGQTPGAGLRFSHGLADRLVLSKLRRKLGLDRCRFLFSGGAPLAAEIGTFFHSVGIVILEGYGLTETTAAAFVNRLDRYRFGTVGLALDVVENKIADDGEILVRGPSIFRGYHNNAVATAEAIDAEGWFHTGDIGQLEDGFLRITDRKKDLIVTAGGKKIAPQMLENALKGRSPLFSQVLAYGDRRPYCVALITIGEEAVKTFGGGDPARAAQSADLRAALAKEVDALNATLASYERIKKFAVLPVDFSEAAGELTPSLKVKRKVVIERYRAVLDGLYDPTV